MKNSTKSLLITLIVWLNYVIGLSTYPIRMSITLSIVLFILGVVDYTVINYLVNKK